MFMSRTPATFLNLIIIKSLHYFNALEYEIIIIQMLFNILIVLNILDYLYCITFLSKSNSSLTLTMQTVDNHFT